jgi:mono/diheme cytochrome c family protein
MRTGLKPLLAALAALSLDAHASLAETRVYKLPDERAELRPGAGVEAAQNNCLFCHSADYVNTQPPGLGAKFWEAEVAKMIKLYGAPITEADARAVADYLARAY